MNTKPDVSDCSKPDVEWELQLMDYPNDSARADIEKNLDLFNDEFTGLSDVETLDVLVTSRDSGKTLGGLIGRTSLGVFFINLFYLPAELRNEGIGSKVLAVAEQEARSRGCKQAVLFTISFQAPGFYERCGYRIFGKIPCEPPGHARVFMTKELLSGELAG